MSSHILPSPGEEWIYSPALVPTEYFDRLLPALKKLCVQERFKNPWTGEDYLTKRACCVFTDDGDRAAADANSTGFSYSKSKTLSFADGPPELVEIKELLEKEYSSLGEYTNNPSLKSVNFDYCLVNIYTTYNDTIGLHSDKEASRTHIASVSLGCSRRFIIRPNDKELPSKDMWLEPGDVVLMLAPGKGQRGCQHAYKHAVPPMTLKELVTVAEERGVALPDGRKTKDGVATKLVQYDPTVLVRVNLTFRTYE